MLARIPNHYSPRLSDLDLRMVNSVPPGGNWKNIPASIPSKRLEQIRESYAAGKGSRSTYYGRLHPDQPSYTINTYFNRPGNGCFLHYDYDGGQHRLVSQREAARLQSFPDSFLFFGSRTSVNKQIGNAVPPLLAFQVAGQLGPPGCFVDLFCGAGGLSLGFKWAGWVPLVANDIDASFLQTYAHNVDDCTVAGDIRDPDVFDTLVRTASASHALCRDLPLFVLGGPPCQGFSTAGKRRSMKDRRNTLFQEYCKVLRALRPSGFVFENVPGILSMQKGKVFAAICSELASEKYDVQVWKLQTQYYGIPQRRTRVLLLGLRPGVPSPAEPPTITTFTRRSPQLSIGPRAPSVREALDDLPPLCAGQDGSALPYRTPPQNAYQGFLRGKLSPAEYVRALVRGPGR